MNEHGILIKYNSMEAVVFGLLGLGILSTLFHLLVLRKIWYRSPSWIPHACCAVGFACLVMIFTFIILETVEFNTTAITAVAYLFFILNGWFICMYCDACFRDGLVEDQEYYTVPEVDLTFE